MSHADQLAANDERVVLARELIGSLQVSEMFETLIPAMLKLQAPMIKKADPRATDEDIEEFGRIFLDEFTSRQDAFMDPMARIYASRFSADDLRALNAYFSSDAGRRMISQQAELAREGMQVGQKFAISIMPEVNRRFKQYMNKKKDKKS
jgi:hypothetical protein